MGAHSTLRITRKKAIEYLVKKHIEEQTKLLVKQMEGIYTNSDLEKVLDKFLDESLYNCIILPDDSEEKNDDNMLY